MNVDHRTYDTNEAREKIIIKMVNLDQYLGPKKIDFIKMDIQGFEYQALLGMKELLSANQHIKLVMECIVFLFSRWIKFKLCV